MSINAPPSALTVRSQQGDYDVVFVDDFTPVRAAIDDPNAFVVADSRVLELYPHLIDGKDPHQVLGLDATEGNKTLAGVERVALFLQSGGATRSSKLVVIGGGIVQDIGAFSAHIYFRGIPFIYVPTTLLSMSDSCIGAKCGLNLGQYKNQIGFFRSPARVIAAPAFLATLARDDIRSGYGEIVKLAIIDSEMTYASIERYLDERRFDSTADLEPIRTSLETKRVVIEEDEYEKGLRKTLNYGHTFAHALETLTSHAIPHGLAVAWGLDVANYIATAKGLLAPNRYQRIHRLLARHFAFDHGHDVSTSDLVAAIRKDKKASSNAVQLILMHDFGDVRIVPTTIDSEFERTLGEAIEATATS